MGERTFAVLGDSISTFEGWAPDGFAVYFEGERRRRAGLRDVEDTWWYQVASALGGRVVANASYSGSMVAGAGFPAASSPERAAALLGATGERPTDVLVFMGTNDYGWGSARAQAAGRSAATPPATDLASIPPAVAGMAPADGLGEFADAYAVMLARASDVLPDARIWCIDLLPGRLEGAAGPTFCHCLRGVDMRAYNDAIAEAAEGCRNACAVRASACGLDYEAVDGTHPTRRGMRQIAAMVLAAMRGDPAGVDPGPFDGDPGTWRSRELCPGRPCVGCGYARGTGNAWFCVCERDWEAGAR